MFLYHLNEFRKAASLPAQRWAEASDLFLQWTGSDSPISTAIKASNEIIKRACKWQCKTAPLNGGTYIKKRRVKVHHCFLSINR